MNKFILLKLKDRLPHKFLLELMHRSNMSKSTVSKTMNGTRHSEPVYDAAIAWAIEIDTANGNRNDIINNLKPSTAT